MPGTGKSGHLIFRNRADAKKWAEKNVGGKEKRPRAGGETKGSYRIKPSGSHGKQTLYTVYYDTRKKSSGGGGAMGAPLGKWVKDPKTGRRIFKVF